MVERYKVVIVGVLALACILLQGHVMRLDQYTLKTLQSENKDIKDLNNHLLAKAKELQGASEELEQSNMRLLRESTNLMTASDRLQQADRELKKANESLASGLMVLRDGPDRKFYITGGHRANPQDNDCHGSSPIITHGRSRMESILNSDITIWEAGEYEHDFGVDGKKWEEMCAEWAKAKPVPLCIGHDIPCVTSGVFLTEPLCVTADGKSVPCK